MEQLSFKECLNILRKHRITFVPSPIIDSEEQLEKLSNHVNYPALLKVYSPDIIHKTKEGFAKTALCNAKELLACYQSFSKLVKKRNLNDYSIVLQEQRQGCEFIIGSKYDQTFGHVVIFGLGGIFTDALHKVSMRICPFSRNEAYEMIEEISKEFPDPAQKKKMIAIIMKISTLVQKEKIRELDLNPVMVTDQGVIIVDVRMMR